MADLIDLDALAEGPPAEPVPWSLRRVEDPDLSYRGVTIKEATFKNKVRFWWRAEQHGATTWHYATCQICRDPMWQVMDSQRTLLRVSTARHKDRHYLRATSNTPASLAENER